MTPFLVLAGLGAGLVVYALRWSRWVVLWSFAGGVVAGLGALGALAVFLAR